MDLTTTALSLRLCTQAELKRVASCTEPHQTIEWETLNWVFHLCPRGVDFMPRGLTMRAGPVIMRTGSMGGDVQDIHGGWLYLSPFHAVAEWREIQEVASAYKQPR